MRIGIYNPYRKTFGGGEQYMFSFAAYFLSQKHTVIYYSENPDDVKTVQERFGLKLDGLTIEPVLFETGTLLQKIAATRTLDILLFYSDGSLPISFAKKTFLVFQFPVPWVKGASPMNRIKLSRIAGVIVNSQFTKQFIDRSFSVDANVMYPSISVQDYRFGKKENLILSVGRFTKGMNTKRHDVIIGAFRRLVDSGVTDWKLKIVGGVLESDMDEFDRTRELAKGYPITVEANIGRSVLISLYSTASFYWHASGYGVNEQEHPEAVEHFGISTLEAMASGTIPFVYPAGGQKEIVEDGVSGYYWTTVDELAEFTKRLITTQKLRDARTAGVFQRAAQFDRQMFNNQAAAYFPLTSV